MQTDEILVGPPGAPVRSGVTSRADCRRRPKRLRVVRLHDRLR